MIKILKIDNNRIYTENNYLCKGDIISDKIEITSDPRVYSDTELGFHYIYEYKNIDDRK